MTITYLSGFETGDAGELIGGLGAGASIQGTTVRTGAYALKQAGTISSTGTLTSSPTQYCIRCYLQVPALPGADQLIVKDTRTGTARLTLNLTSAGKMKVADAGASLGLTATTGTAVLSINTWYRIEMACDLAANGVVKVWVDGTLDINTTHTSDLSASPMTATQFQGAANPNEYFFDDIRIDTGTTTPPGAGRIIARQGATGAPNADAWTKTGLATSALCWSETPLSATNNCNTATASAAQTMLLASFGATQAGHGPEFIDSADTINAQKIGLVGKTSNATTDGADSIRRRVGGVNTDVAISAFTTADLWREAAIITSLTFANLTDGTTEIGVLKTATGTRTHTVEDMWMMLDYTPVPVLMAQALM